MAGTDEMLKDPTPTTTTDISDSENCTEKEYLMKYRDIMHGTTELPGDFDTWTAQEQYDWKYRIIMKFTLNIPNSLRDMVPAIMTPINSNICQEELPEWMDIDKYRRAQKFVSEHYLSIVLTNLLSLVYSFTFDDGLKGFILGGHTHTPYLAFKRYLITVKRMLVWYDGDPWVKGTKAYREMKITHEKHLALTRKLALASEEQIDAALKIENPWCPERELFRKDFAALCPFAKIDQRPYKLMKYIPYTIKPKSINNADMSVVQGMLVVVPILYPQYIGLHNITDEDLESFCYMWRCYGYFLGVEDK
ncbi:hypothetical protein EAI_16828 [Harpegnathos saltator]|uniref:ER-bound oxygenase mpaB/mpaB'/Rubber oxygenase catalytic domain-containing protein n=2 Tax=Harpegnathos saltator TaxID=610380 RepID=E2BU83_HARSA|nr:hypothetical protein EAI_16828 [Harpegnathos saltator]